jgi:hypothetical protein
MAAARRVGSRAGNREEVRGVRVMEMLGEEA